MFHMVDASSGILLFHQVWNNGFFVILVVIAVISFYEDIRFEMLLHLVPMNFQVVVACRSILTLNFLILDL